MLRNDRHHVTSLLRTRPLRPPLIRPGIPALGPGLRRLALILIRSPQSVPQLQHAPYPRLCHYPLALQHTDAPVTLGQDTRTHARTQYLDGAKMRDGRAQLCTMTGLFRVRMSSWTDSVLLHDLIGGKAPFSHPPSSDPTTKDRADTAASKPVEKRRVNRTRPCPLSLSPSPVLGGSQRRMLRMHCGKKKKKKKKGLRVAHLCLPQLCVHGNTPHPEPGGHLTCKDSGNRMLVLKRAGPLTGGGREGDEMTESGPDRSITSPITTQEVVIKLSHCAFLYFGF